MTAQAPGRVAAGPILALAVESLRRLSRNLGRFVEIALLPVLGTFLLELLLARTGLAALLDPMAPQAATVADVALLFGILLLNLVPVSLFAVAWTRVILLGPAAEPGLSIRWGAREFAYFRRLVLLLASLAAIMLAPVILLGGGGAAERFLTVAAGAAALLLFARAMLVLPAAALELRFGLADALGVTRGATPLWILLALAIIYLPFLPFLLMASGLLQATGLVAAAPYASLFLLVAIGYAMQAGAVGLQALLFRHLTGWQPGVRPISV